MQLLSLILFVVYGAGTLIWFILYARFCRELSRLHPEIYEGLGSPSLFLRNNPQNTSALLSFILRQRTESPLDAGLERQRGLMRRYFWCMVALFISMVCAFILYGPPDKGKL